MAGVCFAIALIDASLIGAAAVSLSTAYAIGDVLSVRHSLHRKPGTAKAFYGVYFALIAVAATLVLIPGTPLGLLTNAVQTLAGVLLPSATVFLFLLCNDSAVLGPWVNSRGLNVFTGVVIGLLVTLSVILTAAVLFPDLTGTRITEILVAGVAVSVLAALASAAGRRAVTASPDAGGKAQWQMPPLGQLPPLKLTALDRGWLLVLRAYLLVAVLMVVVRVIQLAKPL